MERETSTADDDYTTLYRHLFTENPRWASQDPLAAMYPSYSPYVLMGGNPISFVDPLGLKPDKHGGDDGGASPIDPNNGGSGSSSGSSFNNDEYQRFLKEMEMTTTINQFSVPMSTSVNTNPTHTTNNKQNEQRANDNSGQNMGGGGEGINLNDVVYGAILVTPVVGSIQSGYESYLQGNYWEASLWGTYAIAEGVLLYYSGGALYGAIQYYRASVLISRANNLKKGLTPIAKAVDAGVDAKLPNSEPIIKSIGAASRAEMLAKKLKMNINSPTTRQVLNSLDESVESFISKYRRSSIRSEIPGEFLNQTVEEALRSGNTTIRKLLIDGRFVK